jgi:hypothetical protein
MEERGKRREEGRGEGRQEGRGIRKKDHGRREGGAPRS